ncbi:hypothetical protein FKM82_011172 [Ascaphus truei]
MGKHPFPVAQDSDWCIVAGKPIEQENQSTACSSNEGQAQLLRLATRASVQPLQLSKSQHHSHSVLAPGELSVVLSV